MTSYEPTCTEPGRWGRAPDADAPAPEILAYLQHCDICEYHAMLNLEDDLTLDVLLRDAVRDLNVGDLPLPAPPARHERAARRLRPGRKDRLPQTHLFNNRFQYERSLTQACIAAFSIVVLWIAFTSYPFGEQAAPAPIVEETAVTPLTVAAPSGQFVADIKAGLLYAPRVLNEYESGQYVQGGVLIEEDQLTVKAPRQVGTVMRVTNPQNGMSVKVKVAERTYEEREIFLSAQAADSLGLDGTAYVFVEVIMSPPPAGLAP